MEALRRIRTMRGMNQVELAKASGVAQNTISEIELGKREARPGTLKKLADALDVEISDLLETQEYSALLKALGFSSEQIASALADNEAELEDMSAKDFLEALLAEPGFRRTFEYYRKNDPRADAPSRSESA